MDIDLGLEDAFVVKANKYFGRLVRQLYVAGRRFGRAETCIYLVDFVTHC
jgi:hypothetical protein